MREAISIQYDAAAGAFVTHVPATKWSARDETYVVQLGEPPHIARATLNEAPAEVQAAFRTLEAWLVGDTETKATSLVADPRVLAERVAKLAADEQRFAAERKARQDEMAALDAAIAEKRAAARP